MFNQVLVTGCAGILGSHLCELYLEQGAQVIGLDNFLTGRKQTVAQLSQHKNFDFIEADIVNDLTQLSCKKWGRLKPGLILNMACPASPPHYQKDPVYTFKINVWGIENCIKLALQSGAVLLQASTSEVYGDPLVHPQAESYWGNVNMVGVRSCYDEGKRGAETLLFSYGQTHQLPYKIVRIFNTYGPRMQPDDGRVISNFVWQAIHNEPLTVYGDGLQTRSYCFVNDLVKGISLLAASPKEITQPVNIGNPQEMTILETAQKILRALPESKSQIVFKPLPKDDPKQRRPDISLAQKLLNWEPKTTLVEGLRPTIDYFKSIS